jgi:SAM-dependent methyltransferase
MNIDTKQLDKLFESIDKNDEFEFIFSYLSLEKYMNVMKILNHRSKSQKLELIQSDTIDINYSEFDKNNEVRTTYRISINGIDNINKYIQQFTGYNSHVVVKTLSKIQDKSVEYMKKTKEKENMIEFTDYDIRVRKSSEEKLTKDEFDKLKNLDHTVKKNSIIFRLKQRISLLINPDLRIDLTNVKTSRHMDNLSNSFTNYELEIEASNNKKITIKDIVREAEFLLKVIQQSNYIISKTEEKQIIDYYKNITDIDKNATKLVSRKPESLEIQYLTDIIPNKYAVTDKADGEHNFLIIYNKKVYLIDSNLYVKNIGIELKTDTYEGSILDGEYIFIPKKNKHLFMIFDCIFSGKNDTRKIDSLMERLSYAKKIVSECFVFGKQKGFDYKDYNGNDKDFNLEKRSAFYDKEITDFMENLNHDIKTDSPYPIIRVKYFIPVTGAKAWEISKYASLLWNKYTNDSNVNCPYMLDGLIYQPLNQIYETSSSKSKYPDLKWKPPNKNSIDFYIEFVRDKKTGKILSVYDNSIVIDDFTAEKPYVICHLHVGNRNKYTGEMEPVLFREKENGYICNLFTSNGKIFDSEKNIINDKTIVEFYYNNDNNVDDRFKWVPIRTRYDKTQQMILYRKEFGNYITVAEKVFRSMTNPILITDFDDLAKGGTNYDTKLNQLKSKINYELIASTIKENKYFQNVEKLVKIMTSFHNYIKSVLIYTHSNKNYTGGKPQSVLEIAFGRGGDINRYFYVQVDFLVGTDIDYDNLISSTNGAKSRYEFLKRTKPNVPRMFFVQADGGSLLNYEDQLGALKGMTNENKYFMEQFFSKDKNKRTLFDRINCNFAIHYMLKNDTTWANFKQNIKDYLKEGGIFSFTTSDAHQIADMFGDNDKYTSHYTTNDGEKKVLWEYVKKYDNTIIDKLKNNKPIGTGHAIDFFASWLFNEGQYFTEYLVDKNFVIKDLIDDCDLELVDTDTFENFMKNNKEFLTHAAKFESVEATRKFLNDAAQYYNSNDNINNACYKHTYLFRYYVFRRKMNTSNKENKDKTKKEPKDKKGGGFIETDILNKEEYEIPNINSTTKPLHDSVHYILQSHGLIPKSFTQQNFYDEFKEINKGFELYHDNGKDKKKILSGLSFMIVEHDCNNKLDYSLNENGNSKVVILYKQGSKYSPVFKKINGGKLAIFNKDDPIIKKMIELV